MAEHYDDFFYSEQKASDKDKFLKLPRHQKTLKCNFDGFYSYSAKITHLDIPARVVPNKHHHYNYARQLLENHYGCQELMSNQYINWRGATHYQSSARRRPLKGSGGRCQND